MLRNRWTSRLRSFPVYALVAALLLPAVPSRAAEQAVDLDGNPLNGAESRVETRVLQTYPVKIENVIYNNAAGQSFLFDWDGAGPGGFASFVVPGPNVGTKWEWTTVSQVYSIQSPVTFRKDTRGLPSFGSPPGGIQVTPPTSGGSFMVPGKSILPTSVTVSSASLTSSLITFFSPEKEVATCTGTFEPGRYKQTIKNTSNSPVTFAVEQPACCPEAHMLICEDGCQSYLTDPLNCGGCGHACSEGEVCDEGACTPVCPGNELICGDQCVDLESDPENCGACGNVCPENTRCKKGECIEPCTGGWVPCGETCVDLGSDRDNCGACGNVFSGVSSCIEGECVGCTGGWVACGEVCVDLESDRDNCGACGNVCSPESTCLEGTCFTGPPEPTAAASFSLRAAAGERERATPRTVPVAVPRGRPWAGTGALDTRSAKVAQAIEEAPVCDIQPIQQVLAPGESFTRCVTGGPVGREVFTTATVQLNGNNVAVGPCALIAPVPLSEVPPAAVAGAFLTDTSGDGLCQPGETCSLFVDVQNLLPSTYTSPVAHLSSAPDAFNPLEITFLSDVASYPDLPALTGTGSCEVAPLLAPQRGLTAFQFTVPSGQAPDVGRLFSVELRDQGGTGPAIDLPFVIGIGQACNPNAVLDGETYDGLVGLLEPVSVQLVPRGNPVLQAAGTYNQTKTMPLKLRLTCGSRTLGPADLAFTPEIVEIRHATLGPIPLSDINAANNANPSDPFFVCGASRCEFQLRTRSLPVGDHVISIKMPDSRVFQAGFTVTP